MPKASRSPDPQRVTSSFVPRPSMPTNNGTTMLNLSGAQHGRQCPAFEVLIALLYAGHQAVGFA
jgi:hypothetical protein